jgi:Holliday junction resolvase
MSKSQGVKGARGENELVGYLRAHGFVAKKISAMYQPGADVEAFNGRVIEVKRRSNPVSKQLEGWLEDVNLVAVRADRGEWHVWLKLDELLDLIEEGPDYEHG